MNTLAALSVLVLAVAIGHSNAQVGVFHWDFCSEDAPCSRGQGDCDNNNQCAGALVCGPNNCNSDFGANVASGMDCCREGRLYDWTWCKPDNKCGHGEGDCDNDDECQDGLVCGTDNCRAISGISGLNAKKDCCYDPEMVVDIVDLIE